MSCVAISNSATQVGSSRSARRCFTAGAFSLSLCDVRCCCFGRRASLWPAECRSLAPSLPYNYSRSWAHGVTQSRAKLSGASLPCGACQLSTLRHKLPQVLARWCFNAGGSSLRLSDVSYCGCVRRAFLWPAESWSLAPSVPSSCCILSASFATCLSDKV